MIGLGGWGGAIPPAPKPNVSPEFLKLQEHLELQYGTLVWSWECRWYPEVVK